MLSFYIEIVKHSQVEKIQTYNEELELAKIQTEKEKKKKESQD